MDTVTLIVELSYACQASHTNNNKILMSQSAFLSAAIFPEKDIEDSFIFILPTISTSVVVFVK